MLDHGEPGIVVLTVKPEAGAAVTAEIYEHTLRLTELEEGVLYFSDSVNQKAPPEYYATQTQIWAKRPGSSPERIKVQVCETIRLQNGEVPYDQNLPFFPCALPVRQVECEHSSDH